MSAGRLLPATVILIRCRLFGAGRGSPPFLLSNTPTLALASATEV